MLSAALAGRRIGSRLRCLASVDSTNDVVAAWAAELPPGQRDGLVVTAEAQRRGRGKGDRRWLSRPGANLAVSIALEPPPKSNAAASHAQAAAFLAADPCQRLVMAAGLAVAAGCEAAAGLPEGTCRLKWPNDVLVEGRKLSGILIERRAAAAVVGIGINVNDAPTAAQLGRSAVCLADLAGGPLDRAVVLAAVLQRLDDLVGAAEFYHSPSAAAALQQAWSARRAEP